jgi:hypothetical protein
MRENKSRGLTEVLADAGTLFSLPFPAPLRCVALAWAISWHGILYSIENSVEKKAVQKSADTIIPFAFDQPFGFSPLIPFRMPKESLIQSTTMA